MAAASFHSYYPVPATACALSAALRRRGLQPSTARDKRCVVQWVPRSRVAWARVLGGSYLLLDSLSDEELVAMQSLLLSGEAEIINSACKPFLAAKLDRVVLPP